MEALKQQESIAATAESALAGLREAAAAQLKRIRSGCRCILQHFRA